MARFGAVETVSDQLTTRDAALLTWIGVVAVWALWRAIRGDGLGVFALVRAFVAPGILFLFLVVVAWQLLVVRLAEQIGLWDQGLLKDTAVVVVLGALGTGFKGLALAEGKTTWQAELRSILTAVIAIQWLSNLRTFPYLVEVALVPLAVLLVGTQAVANSRDEYAPTRRLLAGMVMMLGLTVLVWSIYKILRSLGSTAWDDVGRSFAMAFWLPLALVPAAYLAALAMQYSNALLPMRVVGRRSIRARLDLYAHHRMSLGRLTAFVRTGRAHRYARAESRAERLALLRAPAGDR